MKRVFTQICQIFHAIFLGALTGWIYFIKMIDNYYRDENRELHNFELGRLNSSQCLLVWFSLQLFDDFFQLSALNELKAAIFGDPGRLYICFIQLLFHHLF